MGPNGSGKSTLANTLLGHPSYEITEGSITFKGEDITEAEPHERAKAGPVPRLPVPGRDPRRVGRQLPAHGDQRQTRGADPGQGVPHDAAARVDLLDVDRAFTSRHLNDGFSGGEKKRAEILQMAMLAARRRDPRRDRLGPRHRRAAHGGRGRPAPARRAGPRRADHHPLPAHPALREARVRAHPDGRPDRARGRRRARRAPRARGLRPDSPGGRGGAAGAVAAGDSGV